MTSGPWEGRRVLVTGGSGVIGVELLERLAAAGARTLSVDRDPLPPWCGARPETLRLDLGTADLGPLAGFRPEVVFHLAASFERSVETPDFWPENWNDNLLAGHRVVDLAATVPSVATFVFASSYLVYDPRQYLFAHPPAAATVLDEESPQRPRNLCGHAKLAGEGELEYLATVLDPGLRAVAARIFRVYGRGSRDIVSRWARALLAGEEIEIYQPENRFDYVWAGDVAEGLFRLAAAPGARGVVNLATGTDRSVAEVLAALEAATGRPPRAVRREVEAPFEASAAGLARLRAALEWSPGTDLAAGVGRLVELYRGQGG